jgi:hypothetical protein
MSAQLRELFYYPADAQNDDLPPEPGRKIVYSDDV